MTEKKNKSADIKLDAQKRLEQQRIKDREPVKGIFKFYEVPGGSMSFMYKKYKGDQVKRYDLNDGEVYILPLGVAKHLNKNGWYPIHSYQQDENGKHTTKIGQKVRRFGFQSLEFVDIDDISENKDSILTVEKV